MTLKRRWVNRSLQSAVRSNADNDWPIHFPIFPLLFPEYTPAQAVIQLPPISHFRPLLTPQIEDPVQITAKRRQAFVYVSTAKPAT